MCIQIPLESLADSEVVTSQGDSKESSGTTGKKLKEEQ